MTLDNELEAALAAADKADDILRRADRVLQNQIAPILRDRFENKVHSLDICYAMACQAEFLLFEHDCDFAGLEVHVVDRDGEAVFTVSAESRFSSR